LGINNISSSLNKKFLIGVFIKQEIDEIDPIGTFPCAENVFNLYYLSFDHCGVFMSIIAIFDKDDITGSLTVAADVFCEASEYNLVQMSLEIFLFVVNNVV
jgi:hypothetical protein